MESEEVLANKQKIYESTVTLETSEDSSAQNNQVVRPGIPCEPL